MTERPHTPEITPEGPQPRIWVGSLADYGAGRLHGEWIDAAQPPLELLEAIGRMLARAPSARAEEWGIFDYEDFGYFKLNEYEDLAVVSATAQGIVEHGLAFGAWADLLGGERERLGDFGAAYLGCHDSREDFVDKLLEDFDIRPAIGDDVPEWVSVHISIDRAGIARDLEAGGDLEFVDAGQGKVYVFNGAY